jgi:hypothetical protein
MTREELKQIGIAAGISEHAFGLASEEAWQQVERFAALVAKAEREACADVCDRLARRYGDGPGLEHFQQGFGDGAWVSAKKIRERGQE